MSDHHAEVTTLHAILTREHELLSSLTALNQREQEAIRTLAHRDFREINLARQQCLHDLARQEEARAHCVAALARRHGADPATVTVHDLLAWAGPDQAPALRRTAERLSASIQDIRDGFQANRGLIARFLGFLHAGFSAWTSSASVPTGYSSSGALHPFLAGSTMFEKRG